MVCEVAAAGTGAGAALVVEPGVDLWARVPLTTDRKWWPMEISARSCE